MLSPVRDGIYSPFRDGMSVDRMANMELSPFRDGMSVENDSI